MHSHINPLAAQQDIAFALYSDCQPCSLVRAPPLFIPLLPSTTPTTLPNKTPLSVTNMPSSTLSHSFGITPDKVLRHASQTKRCDATNDGERTHKKPLLWHLIFCFLHKIRVAQAISSKNLGKKKHTRKHEHRSRC